MELRKSKLPALPADRIPAGDEAGGTAADRVHPQLLLTMATLVERRKQRWMGAWMVTWSRSVNIWLFEMPGKRRDVTALSPAGSVRSQDHGVFFDEDRRALDEVVEGDAAFVALAAGADADGLGGGFLVADDQDEGNFLQAELADFGVHLFVAGVEFYAEAGGFELWS